MATAGYINRTKLNNEVANLASGVTADPETLEAYLIEVADQMDANWEYLANLVNVGTLQPYPAFMYRQAIINGNFDIWQRGTSFSGINIYTADRWKYSVDGNGQVHTISRQDFALGQTDVPKEPKHYLRIQVTTAASGQTFHTLFQRVESVRTFAGQKATLSFYAKADTARTLNVTLAQIFGSGGSPSSPVFLPMQSFSLGTNWQKFTVTFDVPSIAGKTLGTNQDDALSVEFHFPLSTTFTIDIAQVQLCAGDVALPFQPRSFAEELALCLRYYERWTFATNERFGFGVAASNTLVYGGIRFAPKRITPTIRTTTPGDYGISGFGGGTIQATAINFVGASDRGAFVDVTANTGFTAGYAGIIAALRAGAYIEIDAEL